MSGILGARMSAAISRLCWMLSRSCCTLAWIDLWSKRGNLWSSWRWLCLEDVHEELLQWYRGARMTDLQHPQLSFLYKMWVQPLGCWSFDAHWFQVYHGSLPSLIMMPSTVAPISPIAFSCLVPIWTKTVMRSGTKWACQNPTWKSKKTPDPEIWNNNRNIWQCAAGEAASIEDKLLMFQVEDPIQELEREQTS